MPSPTVIAGLLLAALLSLTLTAAAREAEFVRGINLNGPGLVIDGHEWKAGADAVMLKETSAFENQKVALKPETDAPRAQMIRSSVYGGSASVSVKDLPAGRYQVFLYLWEDNNSERFNLLLNGRTVRADFQSGAEGEWHRLGPWGAETADGVLTITAQGGTANLSGVEIWSGDGAAPGFGPSFFVTAPDAEETEFFEKRIRPVLAEHCQECHSAAAVKLGGGLLLDSRAGVMKGGDNGAVIAPGDPDNSRLILAVRHSLPDLKMPKQKPKLPPEAIADLERWVRMGAPDPRSEDTVKAVAARSAIDWNKGREWWAFRPLTAPALPSIKDAAWPANEIDHFTLARMEAAGLQPAADAEKRVLIRRATFDLTGLPPSPEEIETFLADTSPDAFSKLVDRLLDSPRYGERWGRHWLDVVRYADTAGDNSDFPIPQMHLYRDWVIDAFNRDMPWDQFVRAQIAGDLQETKDDTARREGIVATGYIANARRFGSRVDDYPTHLTIEDTLDNLGRAFLGLTVNCARCHDHKFDPIGTKDYYALYGIFNSTRYPWPGIELEQRQRDLIPLAAPGKEEEAASELRQWEEEHQKRLADAKHRKEEADKAPPDKKQFTRDALAAADKQVADWIATPPAFQIAYAVKEKAPDQCADVMVQVKGNPANTGDRVPRRFLMVLGGAELPPSEKGSGRKELAEWLTDPDNPLPGRVIANRLWQWHFGAGIAPTPNDFGKQGRPPTHPELLDWLALRFRESGWSVKAMHRLILLSRTWRLSSERSADATERDPVNTWLSSSPRRRLDAESIRDTLLLLGGSLDFTRPGRHPFPPQNEWKFTQHDPFKAVYPSNHRSVYLMTQRIQRHPYLAIFDGADPAASTAARAVSTTPLQALYLLNNPLVHEQAANLARRLREDTPEDASRLQRAWLLTLGRPPRDDEAERSLTFLNSAREKLRTEGASEEDASARAWESMVRVIFRFNEFIYPD